MFSIEIENGIVTGVDRIRIDNLKAHEEVVIDRAVAYYNYLKSIEQYRIIPSILVCSKTFTIIDGHHRAWSLRKLGYELAPVTLLNYDNDNILPHLNSKITKEDILKAAQSNILLTPKSSAHHVIDKKGTLHPMLVISTLFEI